MDVYETTCSSVLCTRPDDHIVWHLERVKHNYPSQDVHIHSQMVNASRSGNINLIKQLVQTNPQLFPCLGCYVWIATLYRRYDILQFLLNFGASPNGSPASGRVPVYDAICQEDSQSVQILLQNGVDVNADVGNGSNILVTAVSCKNANILKLLLNNGCVINKPDNFGMTALHKAVHTRQQKIVKLLLDSGADPNIPNQMNACPLHLVLLSWDLRRSRNEETNIIKDLIRSGSNVSQPYAQSDGRQLRMVSPLQMAIQCEEPMLVEMLLHANASLVGIQAYVMTHRLMLCRRNQYILAFLRQCCHNPKSLKSLCRHTILDQLMYCHTVAVQMAVKTLPLPLMVMNYLSFPEFDHLQFK